MKAIKTWIVVADGTRARVLLNDGVGHGIKPVRGLEFTGDAPPTREINADKPGRSFDSGGQGRHAMEPATDPHRHRKAEFIRALARRLEQEYTKGAYNRLVLVAPPSALGDLRAALPAALRGIVTGELAKDLTKLPDHELAQHLQTVLAV